MKFGFLNVKAKYHVLDSVKPESLIQKKTLNDQSSKKNQASNILYEDHTNIHPNI